MPLLQKAYLGSTALFKDTAWFENDDTSLVASNNDATITADTNANTKGAWTQLIASTAGQTTFAAVAVGSVGASATNTATLLDLAVGASGSEVAIASNVAIGSANSGGQIGTQGISVAFPVDIPSGSRVSARIQSVVTGGKTARLSIYLYDYGDNALVPASVDVLGTTTNNSEGTSLGASNAWQQVVASTSQAYTGVCLVPSAASTAMISASGVQLDVGVGASGSEVVFGSITTGATGAELIMNYIAQPVFFSRAIPAGSRLAVRQSSANTWVDACLIAVPKV